MSTQHTTTFHLGQFTNAQDTIRVGRDYGALQVLDHHGMVPPLNCTVVRIFSIGKDVFAYVKPFDPRNPNRDLLTRVQIGGPAWDAIYACRPVSRRPAQVA